MRTNHITQTWGYKLLADNCINFYHVLLPTLPNEFFYQQIPGISYIEKNNDGSITFYIEKERSPQDILTSILDLCTKKSLVYLETPKYYYKIPPVLRQSFLSWAIAFEGCLAILLTSDVILQQYIHGNWEYINAHTGGLYLSPFTLLLNKEYPKIVHPATMQNYKQRNLIEQKTSFYIRKMFRRMLEAQQGLEGMALLSMVEEKSRLPNTMSTQIINTKSFNVKTRIYSPFFSSLYNN